VLSNLLCHWYKGQYCAEEYEDETRQCNRLSEPHVLTPPIRRRNGLRLLTPLFRSGSVAMADHIASAFRSTFREFAEKRLIGPTVLPSTPLEEEAREEPALLGVPGTGVVDC